MIKTYFYSRSGFLHFLRGFVPFYRRSELINTCAAATQGKKVVWRNDYTNTLKITEAYVDKPVELGNFLFLRTREWELGHNVYTNSKSDPSKAFASAKNSRPNFLTGGTLYGLYKVEEDLRKGFHHLKEMLSIIRDEDIEKIPVSFASNVLYACEKNGLRNEEMYKRILFPILKNKAQYLHAEGVSCAIWALGQLENVDSDVLKTLIDTYNDRNLGSEIVYVKNARLSSQSFVSAEGSHQYEWDLKYRLKSPKAKQHKLGQRMTDMYFKDNIVALELYHGLKNLSSKSLGSGVSSKVSEIVGSLESHHGINSDLFSVYKELTNDKDKTRLISS